MLLFVSIFCAVFVGIISVYLVISDVFLRGRPRFQAWVTKELQEREVKRARQTVAFKTGLAPDVGGGVAVTTNGEEAPTGLMDRLATWLERAGLLLRPWQLLALALGLGVVLAVGVGVLLGPVAAAAAGLAGLAAPFAWVAHHHRRRRDQLFRQLPDAFDLIARVVRSGSSVSQAMRVVSEEFGPPLSIELAYCYEQQRLGLHAEVAYRQLADRTDVMELKAFVMAVLIHQKSGGNLAELLDLLARVIRDRVRIRGQIRILTAQGRAQAIVLMILPFVMFALLSILHPSYAQVLLERPQLLVIMLISMALGALWINRIVDIDV